MAKTILAVDDSGSLRQMVTFSLSAAGYDVVALRLKVTICRKEPESSTANIVFAMIQSHLFIIRGRIGPYSSAAGMI